MSAVETVAALARHHIAIAIALPIIANVIGFVVSAALATDLLYDLIGAGSHVAVAVAGVALSQHADGRALVVAALVAVWAVRLGIFLFTRALRAGGDSRFDKIKRQPARFAIAWTLQTVWVLLNASPLLVLLSAPAPGTGPSSAVTNGWDAAWLVVWAAAFVMEVVADEQKRRFRADPRNAGAFIATGLWRYSRHPNYAAEIVCWWALAAYAAPGVWARATALGGSPLSLLALASPLFVTWLLLRVSGIPLLEAAAKKRWGEDAR